ncbi:hypothetical protein LSAT2_015665 [Lamellibrachia satsuma]|nr:hypothetical protein LSAT2_015665 [Lamellibrachia satsuma]
MGRTGGSGPPREVKVPSADSSTKTKAIVADVMPGSKQRTMAYGFEKSASYLLTLTGGALNDERTLSKNVLSTLLVI